MESQASDKARDGLSPMNYPSASSLTIPAKEEMDFRLSLLRLMTVPHKGPSDASLPACQQVEELSVLAVVPKKSQQ